MQRLVIALLSLASFCWGQNSKTVSVTLLPENNDASRKAGEEMAGKIGSSSRYELKAHSKDTKMWIDIACIPLQNNAGGYTGFACSEHVTYFPLEDTRFKDPVLAILNGIETNLSSDITACAHIQDCASDMFNHFVQDTQPERLTTAETRASAAAFNWREAQSHGTLQSLANPKGGIDLIQLPKEATETPK